VKEFCRR